MAYGNEIKKEALRKAGIVNRQLMLLRQQANARYYRDNLK